MKWRRILPILLVCRAAAQTPVAEITVTVEPPAIRPLETAVVRVRVYGPGRTRLQAGGVEFRISDGGGWLSRPFAYQGAPDGERQQPRGNFRWRARADLATMDPGDTPALRDSVLYTAPRQPGVYRMEAALEGKTAAIVLRVTPDAPSRRQAEQVSFRREQRDPDPYFALAAHYAPYVAQETWFEPKADYLARFDFDGNRRGDDNWEHTPVGSSQAYVYYAVMETGTHWFLQYDFFHPRDYAERCFLGTCHENDNEGLILTVRKQDGEFGRLEAMQTLAHGRIRSYRAGERVQPGLLKIAGGMETYAGSHPVVFVEAGGHGVYGSEDRLSRYCLQRDEFGGGTGVTYLPGDEAGRPAHANDRRVAYELLPIYEEWWSRAADGRGRADGTFEDECPYQPLGGRPGLAVPGVPCRFLGRAQARNRARPFWSWLDPATRAVLAAGQWGLDPAYAVSKLLRFPAGESFSVDYIFNPFLRADGH